MAESITIRSDTLRNYCNNKFLPIGNDLRQKFVRAAQNILMDLTDEGLLDFISLYSDQFDRAYLHVMPKKVVLDSFLDLRKSALMTTMTTQNTDITLSTEQPITEPQPTNDDTIDDKASPFQEVEPKKKSKRTRKLPDPEMTPVVPDEFEPTPRKIFSRPSKAKSALISNQLTWSSDWIAAAPYFPSICTKPKCYLCLTQFLGAIVSPCTNTCTHPGEHGVYPHTSAVQLKRLAHLHSKNVTASHVLLASEPTPHNFGALTNYYPIYKFKGALRQKLEDWAEKCNSLVDANLPGSDSELDQEKNAWAENDGKSETSLHCVKRKKARHGDVFPLNSEVLE